jgi:hypothetical protein
VPVAIFTFLDIKIKQNQPLERSSGELTIKRREPDKRDAPLFYEPSNRPEITGERQTQAKAKRSLRRFEPRATDSEHSCRIPEVPTFAALARHSLSKWAH